MVNRRRLRRYLRGYLRTAFNLKAPLADRLRAITLLQASLTSEEARVLFEVQRAGLSRKSLLGEIELPPLPRRRRRRHRSRGGDAADQ